MLYHVTWFVNSASHTWGAQEYATGDQSRNNWWVGWLAFGEGWHNNHHAFEYSARYGAVLVVGLSLTSTKSVQSVRQSASQSLMSHY